MGLPGCARPCGRRPGSSGSREPFRVDTAVVRGVNRFESGVWSTVGAASVAVGVGWSGRPISGCGRAQIRVRSGVLGDRNHNRSSTTAGGQRQVRRNPVNDLGRCGLSESVTARIRLQMLQRVGGPTPERQRGSRRERRQLAPAGRRAFVESHTATPRGRPSQPVPRRTPRVPGRSARQ